MRLTRFLLSLAVFIGFASSAFAQGEAPPRRSGSAWAYDVEYLAPSKSDRRLDTVDFDLLYAPGTWNRRLRERHLDLYAGCVATTVTGSITQLTGSFAEGTLKRITYASSGNGIGPDALLRYDAIRGGKATLALDGSGGIVLYDRRFPAGGDRYNFMWRAGSSFSYRLDRAYTLGVGYRWMHVSNGQGLTPRNPSYEARGINLQLIRAY